MDGIGTYVFAGILGTLQLYANLPKPFPLVDFLSGNDSQVQAPAVRLATDAKSWNDVWQFHMFPPAVGNVNNPVIPSAEIPPTVDFNHNEVVAVFGGLVRGLGGYKVESSIEQGNEIKVHVMPVPLLNNRTLNLFTNPYAFFVFPRTDKKFDIQAPFTDQDGNTVWKTVATVGGETKKTGG